MVTGGIAASFAHEELSTAARGLPWQEGEPIRQPIQLDVGVAQEPVRRI
jgi:hypothetical protein